MVLSNTEFHSFLNAHLRLLHYCYCKKYKLEKELSFEQFIKKPFDVKVEARKYFYENRVSLNEYLDKNKQISDSDKEILSGFNRKISGKFVILKQLKFHAVFMDIESEKFYAIVALSDPFQKLIDSLPVLIETTILPFNDKIIYDGFLTREIYIGKNMENNMLHQYREAKVNKMIIKTIE